MKNHKKKDSALQGGGLDKGLKLTKGDERSPDEKFKQESEKEKQEGYIPPLETQHDQVVREEQEAVKGAMQAQEDEQDS